MTIADVSPRFAVKRIILLYENFQYREAANFINRLSHGTFKVILNDLPIDLFVESMPHSLSILEALYAKVFLSDGLNFSMKLLRPEGVIMQMVKFFSSQESIDKTGDKNWELCGPFICSCKKLLKVIVLSDPKIKKVLQQRRRTLDKAIEGLGQHGLVGTTDETLMNLHDALKMEFQRVVETYKGALQKLEDLSLASNKNGVTRGPAPVQASHQRQLSLRQPEIQERLIKNKTLLNVVEPTLGNHSLDILLGILQRRIEFDKDVLFQFTQLRKEMKDLVEANAVVAPVLMRFSHGFVFYIWFFTFQVLELMKEVAEDEDDSSDISGYHSDSDSAIMMSGNSPYVSKRARYNFLSRSAPSDANSNMGEHLVRCYGNLYAAARVDALDSLDNLPALKDADELKSKILFSVVVLAFRSAQSLLALKKDHVRRILHIQPPTVSSATPPEPVAAELERSVAIYLRKTVDKFDLAKSIEEVCCQIWATLYDYPCLKSCPGLVQYVKDAVHLAWGLVNQSPPFILEYEQRTLRRDVHVRFHSSNPESEQIRTYLWPALLEGIGGPCVHKAVVIT
ncbi:hypothetical protein L798_12370 [Zootermopsis nevadensis]|uniref:Mitochondria-eating protein n=1 Tax=Zootermopsis nevadensis TaxID=136037 RepID=A0A067RKK6_ZOONE|nr:hypothetical protein L798_12370 [Zootermopsis nevadensis]